MRCHKRSSTIARTAQKTNSRKRALSRRRPTTRSLTKSSRSNQPVPQPAATKKRKRNLTDIRSHRSLISMALRFLREKGQQVRYRQQQRRVRGTLHLISAVRAREDADVPANAGVMPCVKVERRVADICDIRNAGDAGDLHRAEYQIRCGTSVFDIVAADHGIDGVMPIQGID